MKRFVSPARLVGFASAAAVAFTLTSPASAQGFEDSSSAAWRSNSERRFESPQSWALEVRLGHYKPRIDEEFGGSGPYEAVFGTDKRWYIGLELDYQALRIPHVGTFGPGFAIGYTSMSAKAKLTGSEEYSAEETSLWIMPMYAVGVLRVDVLANELGVPLVPYVKLGLGYALWKTSDGSGTSDYPTSDGTVDGKGRSYGWHFAPGIMLQLDPLDRHAARQLDNSVGVNHSYFFLEWMRSELDGFGADDQMQVGTSTWTAGLAFEF